MAQCAAAFLYSLHQYRAPSSSARDLSPNMPKTASQGPKSKQLSEEEMAKIDEVTRSKGGAAEALKAVNAMRSKASEPAIHLSAMYRYLGGETHKRGPEKRGSKPILSRLDKKKLERARVRLIKKQDNEAMVRYQDIVDEADLDCDPCLRTVQDFFRNEEQVRMRTPRLHVGLAEKDAQKRFQVAKVWKKRPGSYWSTKVHAYHDVKGFVMPLTPAQRKKYKQTKITGHLRKRSEGTARGFTKPRTNHSWLGMPSVDVAAAVSGDKVIMWHYVTKPWNGQKAAKVYTGPLKKALRKKWGTRRSYQVVEDGDRKGYQSNKGLKAKAATKIKAITLPPRSPNWMPLDYAVWTAVEKKALSTAPRGTESKEQYMKRLARCARSLPRGMIRKAIGGMKMRIQETFDNKGYHGSRD